MCAALCCSSSSAQSFFGPAPPSDLQSAANGAEGLIAKAKALCGPKVGETGIGFGAGCVAGFACKKVQNIVVGAAFLTGGIAGGACLAGWVKPEDLKDKAEQIMDKGVEKVHENMDKLTGIMAKLDADGDGKVDLSDSKLVLSKFYKKHSGFSMGLVGGALVGYRMG